MRLNLGAAFASSLGLHALLLLLGHVGSPTGLPGAGETGPLEVDFRSPPAQQRPASEATAGQVLAMSSALPAQAIIAPAAEPKATPAPSAVEPTTASEPAPSASTRETSVPPSPGAGGVVQGPWYYPARYLHRRVSPMRVLIPTVPTGAGDVAGRVELLLRVNPQGRVDDYEILASEPPGLFDRAVIDTFVQETYAPGMIMRAPVRALLHVEVIFEAGAAPTTTLDFSRFLAK